MPNEIFSLNKLIEILNVEESFLTEEQKKVWSKIKIPPEQWTLMDVNFSNEKFWAVGICGRYVIWYNNIEEGFICDIYCEYKILKNYYADQNRIVSVLVELFKE